MTAMITVVKDGRVNLGVPADWPDGTEVEIRPVLPGVITPGVNAGLCREGNVLVHRGKCAEPVDAALDTIRKERLVSLVDGVGG